MGSMFVDALVQSGNGKNYQTRQKNMNVRRKLMAGYLLAAWYLITLSGVFGVYGTEKIVTLLQGKDEHLRSIVISASKLTLDAKDAETDITLYFCLETKRLRRNTSDTWQTYETL